MTRFGDGDGALAPTTGEDPSVKAAFSVLVVEDDEHLAALLGRMLPLWFAQTVVVGSVADGNAALRAEAFDVVLTDYHLGDGTGTDVLRLAATLRPDARRVLWSGHVEAIGQTHCAHVVLPKPIDLGTLYQALHGTGSGRETP